MAASENATRHWQPGDVSVAILNYNGRGIVGDCLDSILALEHAPAEILVVDDGSTDGGPEWIRSRFPEVRVVGMGSNTKLLNRVRNRALQESRSRLVLIVDNDVTLRADCLDELLDKMNTLPRAAVCMPRAVCANAPERIYQDGQWLHYVGASNAHNRNALTASTPSSPRVSIGWGVQLIDRTKALSQGGFDEAYAMGWGDDGEFNHRLNMTGNRCYHVPTAVVVHKRSEAARRYYGTVRNRVRFLLTCYSLRTLLLCAPALVVYEIALGAFLSSQGAFGQYIRGWRDALAALGSIRAERRRVQAARRVRDSELMGAGPVFIATDYVRSWPLAAGARLLSFVLDAYWRGVRRFV
jgi:GT2 family glycosyltransferase